MKKQIAVRNYNLSDGSLVQVADGILKSIDRDMVEFGSRGMSPLRYQRLQYLRDKFAETDSDEILEGTKMVATEHKNLLRGKLETALRMLIVIVENRWGRSTAKFRQLGDTHITAMTDENFVRSARVIIRVVELNLMDLMEEGMTNDLVHQAVLLREQFDAAIDAQLVAVRNRDIATEERITRGNELYAELVKATNTGKDIWYSTNEAKYNDYVIYDGYSRNETAGTEGSDSPTE